MSRLCFLSSRNLHSGQRAQSKHTETWQAARDRPTAEGFREHLGWGAHVRAPQGLPLPSPPESAEAQVQLSLPSSAGQACLLSCPEWLHTAVKRCAWSLRWKLYRSERTRGTSPPNWHMVTFIQLTSRDDLGNPPRPLPPCCGRAWIRGGGCPW